MNTLTKLTRHFVVLAALISSVLSLSAVTVNVGYITSSVSFSFSANTDAEIYIRNLDTNEVVARGWYDYFSGCHAETYIDGPSGYGYYDSGEVYDLPPGNYELEIWGPGTLGGSSFNGGWGSVWYTGPYANSITFGIN
ncbi:MAG: hypothetical protein QM715_17880 [Nibricoccus sp.]